MSATHCACGWTKPLIAVTTDGGEPPFGDLLVVVVCPSCGDVYRAGERAPSDPDVLERLKRAVCR